MNVYNSIAAGVTYVSGQPVIDNMAYTVPVYAKTASMTINPAQYPSGTLFTNRGATGAVTFTLPAPSASNAGHIYHFFAVAAQALAVSCSSKLVTFNNATASSVTLGTSGEIIGGGMTVISDGTSWLVILHTEETQTVTVA